MEKSFAVFTSGETRFLNGAPQLIRSAPNDTETWLLIRPQWPIHLIPLPLEERISWGSHIYATQRLQGSETNKMEHNLSNMIFLSLYLSLSLSSSLSLSFSLSLSLSLCLPLSYCWTAKKQHPDMFQI